VTTGSNQIDKTQADRLTKQRAPLNNAGMANKGLLDQLKFDSSGLIPLIVQDVVNGQVLMMAFMNRTALEKTLETGKIHTYSRSRGRLALKGESSAHFQHVKKVLTDCDKDVVLIQVVQDVAACHEGYRSCFFREYEENGEQWKTIAEKQFDPEKVYSK
jgi:phosphoribosyl-AMP cyclohydrolase